MAYELPSGQHYRLLSSPGRNLFRHEFHPALASMELFVDKRTRQSQKAYVE